MKFKCPHCKEETITFKDKIMASDIIPSECSGCNNGYVNNKAVYIIIALFNFGLFLLIPSNVNLIIYVIYIVNIFVSFLVIGLFFPVKKTNLYK